ncbi:hypothetical protein AArcSl_0648 [Halalkaliarchaeum desulfuricum]|uniref:Uncharacterized protein n=1 Tax=Halalkaliarchaeum desulfuricum TaxID=2055893 RepID=A0A343TGS6_9EURY|nr:hypothetical protein [Halalkaliarchaeum desulfuricum]AUX08298.1 hypothetical protein AArcSl_0648 [Halalkaliarchaeum desulfuricum]
MNRRTLILLLGGTSAGALTLGTDAFSSGTVERAVNAEVGPDDESLVGYEVQADENSDENLPEVVVTAGENEKRSLVSIKNRFKEDAAIEIVDVKVATQDNEEPNVVDVEWDEGSFGSGDSADICGKIACEDEGTDIVELTVTIEGSGITTSLFGDTNIRRLVVRCESEISA